MNLDVEQALFDACVAADADQREALLAGCGDAALAARVRRLLSIHDAWAIATRCQTGIAFAACDAAEHRTLRGHRTAW